MPVVETFDRAHEFRFVIKGRFAGECVRDTCSRWASTLNDTLGRNIVVDISCMTGYDNAGRKSLRDMHLHGTEFAASTVASLAFLAEITAPRRRHVTIMPETAPEPLLPANELTRGAPPPLRAAAGRKN